MQAPARQRLACTRVSFYLPFKYESYCGSLDSWAELCFKNCYVWDWCVWDSWRLRWVTLATPMPRLDCVYPSFTPLSWEVRPPFNSERTGVGFCTASYSISLRACAPFALFTCSSCFRTGYTSPRLRPPQDQEQRLRNTVCPYTRRPIPRQIYLSAVIDTGCDTEKALTRYTSQRIIRERCQNGGFGSEV
jgi:hypothetical protein